MGKCIGSSCPLHYGTIDMENCVFRECQYRKEKNMIYTQMIDKTQYQEYTEGKRSLLTDDNSIRANGAEGECVGMYTFDGENKYIFGIIRSVEPVPRSDYCMVNFSKIVVV